MRFRGAGFLVVVRGDGDFLVVVRDIEVFLFEDLSDVEVFLSEDLSDFEDLSDVVLGDGDFLDVFICEDLSDLGTFRPLFLKEIVRGHGP